MNWEKKQQQLTLWHAYSTSTIDSKFKGYSRNTKIKQKKQRKSERVKNKKKLQPNHTAYTTHCVHKTEKFFILCRNFLILWWWFYMVEFFALSIVFHSFVSSFASIRVAILSAQQRQQHKQIHNHLMFVRIGFWLLFFFFRLLFWWNIKFLLSIFLFALLLFVCVRLNPKFV